MDREGYRVAAAISVLRALAESGGGPLTLSEIARRARVTQAVASREVMLLSSRGLVEVRRGPKRAVNVRLTERGYQALITAEQLLSMLGVRV